MRDITLWVEKGFSRSEIAPRMALAVPGLKLISTPQMVLPDTQVIPVPDFSTPEVAAETANRLIAQYDIDAFWPQDSAHFDLSALDCTVHAAASPEVVALVDDKARFSEWLGGDPLRANATEAIGVDAVAAEYYRREAQGRNTCVKPVIGVCGRGYWHLTQTPAISMLEHPNEREIYPESYFAELRREEGNEPARILVMDYLPGPEVSIDVLCWHGQPLIHAARTKLDPVTKADPERQIIQSEHPLLQHAYSLLERLHMHGLIGIQYRLDAEGNWKVLEINPRPAGGTLHSEDAGFGLLSAWAQLVAGLAGPEDLKQFQGAVELTFAYQRFATAAPTQPLVL